jgi:hypothetical protein
MSASVIAGVPLAQFAAVTAALAEGFALRMVLSVEGLEAVQWAAADRGWTELLDRDPTLLAAYEADLAAAKANLVRDAAAGDGRAAGLRIGKARLVRSGTGLGSAAVEAPRAAAEAPSTPSQPPRTASEPAPAPSPPALPPELLRFRGIVVDPNAPRTVTRVGATAPAMVLPFHPTAPREVPASAPPSTSMTAAEMDTQAGFEAAEVFPFSEGPSSDFFEQRRSRPPAAEGAGSDGATAALPSAVGDELRKRVGEAPATPWDASTPPVPLERHASLCLEIAVDPARAAEVLARYQVTAVEKARADDHYRARIAADPALGAEWNSAYSRYHAWFTSRLRP